jgi:DNA-binding CsgD family transcriptional regulator
MILKHDEVNEHNFDEHLPEIINPNHRAFYNYRFLLCVSTHINEDQEDILKPYIVDRFITEMFELAEWEGRFKILENAKEIYTKELFGDDPAFSMYKISDSQSIFVSKDYPDEVNDTLVIPVNLFKESNLAPMEIIVWVLKTSWNKSYSTIAKMLNRDPRTIETTFKRAVAKMGND